MKTAKPPKKTPPRLLTNGAHRELAHDDIARHAYVLWEQRGRPHDQDVGIWLQAEAQLRQARSPHDLRA